MLRLLLSSVALALIAFLSSKYWSSELNPATYNRSSAAKAGFSARSRSVEKPAHNSASEIEILLSTAKDVTSEPTIEVHGLPRNALASLGAQPPVMEEWRRLFLVLTQKAADNPSAALPPVFGEYSVDQQVLTFRPRFPFVVGLTYVARFNHARFLSKYGEGSAQPKSSADWIQVEISIPKTETAASTFVHHIFPSTSVVPVNLLKFYIQFSAPMSLGEAYKRIHLYEEPNREIEDAFLQVEQELWDPSQMRLTLLLDPGRIKRGLQPHQDLGLALQVGKTYRLMVDAEWLDAQGNPLIAAYEKRFQVTDIDRTAPDQTDWQWNIPVAGTTNPLTIAFPEPLDQALLQRMLEVRTAQGGPFHGELRIGEKEMEWQFHPGTTWSAGSFMIRVNTALEDLAGNNLRGVFDLDLQSDKAENDQRYISLPFEVKTKH